MSIMMFWVMGFASALKQVRAHLSAQPRMVALLLLVSVFRIGVASHPGPDAEFSSFVLGITNPTGVHCQATYVTEHTAYADVWALGETHLGYHDLQYDAYSVAVADPSMCRIENVEQMPADPPPAPEWHGLLPLRPTPLGAIRWYGDSVVSKLIQWLWTAMAVGQGPYKVWNSNVQVYVDYALQTGDVDPIRVRGWPDRAVYSLHALQHLSFKERARWFGKVLRKILRHAGMSVSSTYCRPASHVVRVFACSLAMPWCAQWLDDVDRWLMKFSRMAFSWQTRVLDSLPVQVTVLSHAA
jgi:hypothetical protein